MIIRNEQIIFFILFTVFVFYSSQFGVFNLFLFGNTISNE